MTFENIKDDAALYFKLEKDAIFFQNDQKQIYMPKMKIKDALFPLNVHRRDQAMPEVKIVLRSGAEIEHA